MINHKEGCQMNGLDMSVSSEDSMGNSETIQITDEGITQKDDYSTQPFKIKFNFCPVCGVEITQKRNKSNEQIQSR